MLSDVRRKPNSAKYSRWQALYLEFTESSLNSDRGFTGGRLHSLKSPWVQATVCHGGSLANFKALARRGHGSPLAYQTNPWHEDRVIASGARAREMVGAARSGLVVLIPAYNEERFIGSVVLKALRHASRVVVVDDGSTDATAAIAEAAGARVLRHARNQGKGAALNTGFRFARELGATIVVTLDGDGQHLVEELDTVIAPILAGKADLVVGSRYLGARSRVPWPRVFGHWLFNFVATRSTGVRLSDSQSGFRAFSERALRQLSFQARGFAVESEMQFMARDFGLRTLEVPITILYHDRPKRPVFQHGLLVFNGCLALIGQYRPLLLFGTFGFVFLLLGIGWDAWVVRNYLVSQQFALGYALIGELLTLFGTLSLFSGIVLHSVRGLLLGVARVAGPDPLPGSSGNAIVNRPEGGG